MPLTTLETLLARIRDGESTDAELARARELLASDERFPAELRADALDDEPEFGASALLALLGHDDGLGASLGAALLFEAGSPFDAQDDAIDFPAVDIAGLVADAIGVPEEPVEAPRPELVASRELTAEDVEALEAALPLPLTAAISAEAGTVDVAVDVLAALGVSVLPIAEAVHYEAGLAPVDAAVLAAVGRPVLPMAAAVHAEAGEIELAASVASAIGDQVLPLAAALRAEAGLVDVADAVLEAIGGEARVPVSDAVRSEAGEVDVWPELAPAFDEAWLSAMLDGELAPAAHRVAAGRLGRNLRLGREMTAFADIGQQLRSAVAEEAGEAPSVWSEVAKAIGIADPEEVVGYDGAEVAAAIRAEAGTVDVTAAVMATIRRQAVVPVEPEIPEPANDSGFSWGAVAAVAAVLLVVVGVARVMPFGGSSTETSADLTFASAAEITVNELSYDENTFVQVIQAEADDGGSALIIWVDEEA